MKESEQREQTTAAALAAWDSATARALAEWEDGTAGANWAALLPSQEALAAALEEGDPQLTAAAAAFEQQMQAAMSDPGNPSGELLLPHDRSDP